MHSTILIISTLVLIVSSIIASLFFKLVYTKETKARGIAQNAVLTIFSTLYILLAAELLFTTFFIHSEGSNQTLVAKKWHQLYWKPINSQGYRDHEHQWKPFVLFILGDSFIAGHGIKDIDNRLSGELSRKLGADWTVATLAKNGWSTQDQLNALIEHEHKPDRIVASYFINDIAPAAQKFGLTREKIISHKPPKTIALITENSYLVNWLYWNIKKSFSLRHRSNYFEQAYGNKKIWTAHKAELKKLINTAKQKDIRIDFIIWPILTDITGSTNITNQVGEFLQSNGVRVINLSKKFRDRAPEKLIVNKWDGHPNKEVNLEVGALIYETLGPWK